MEELFQRLKTEIRIKEKRRAEEKNKRRGQKPNWADPGSQPAQLAPELAQTPLPPPSLTDRPAPPVITPVITPPLSPSQ
jgi:hypothetical protein